MPHARDPDPISPRLPATPLCAACGTEMRLVLAKPHSRFINLDACTFKCNCGEEGEYAMARSE